VIIVTNPGQTLVELRTGVRLQVSSIGAGDPLVLVCGTGLDHRIWAPLVPALAERYRVITYNYRGIGDSERGQGAITVASLAEDLDSLMDALDVERAHLLGWSLGGAVSQELALSRPSRVASLVLAFTWARTTTFQASLFTVLAHPWRTGDRAAGLAGLGLAFSPELLDSEQFGPLMAKFEPLFPTAPSQIAAAVEQWDADLAHDLLNRLPQITSPTLVISGEQDLLTPAAQGRVVAGAIPDARYELLTGPGSSHAALLERPQEVAGLVLEFLGAHSPTPA
jgi:pimeloyl-ACP methyl ester carboxylesterase